MRSLLLLLPVVLAGCGTSSFISYSVSQREILKRSKEEIAKREPWAADAAIIVKNTDNYTRFRWKVKAGALDRSDFPSYKGIYFVSGTERELQFTRSGCLTSYASPGDRCQTAVTTDSSGVLMAPEK